MIYTVTLNPSLDYIVKVDDFKTGRVNRTSDEMILPGGKGINVSIVLNNLGLTSTALGFVAGFTGKEIASQVNNLGLNQKFINVENGNSRINVKLRSIEETEINGQGPTISKEELDTFFSQIDSLSKGDVLVLAGSIPGALPDSMYHDIMNRIQNKGVLVIVDATRDLLCNVLELKPFLVKPNNYELGEIFGVELNKREEVIPYAVKLHEQGARNVLVSMAGQGAVMVDENGSIYESPATKGKVVNSVGAGDSMVAGFIYGYIMTGNYEEAFYTGIAAGSASAFSKELATGSEIKKILVSLRGVS